MKLFIKKAWRDLRRKKLRSVPIILIIFMGGVICNLYFSLYYNWLEVEGASWNDHRYHHLLVNVKPMARSNLTDLITRVKSNEKIIVDFEIRAFLDVQSAKNHTNPVKTHLYAINDQELTVDKLYYHTGYINTLHKSEKTNDIVVDKVTAEIEGWNLGDTLTISASHGQLNGSIVAFVDSPEYMVTPGLLTEFYSVWGGPIVWMKYDDLVAFSKTLVLANQIAFYFKDPSQKNQFLVAFLEEVESIHGINSVLHMQGRDLFLSSIGPTFSGMAFILIFVFASIAAVMIFIVLKRIIEEELRTLGLFKSLGFTNRELITSALAYSLIIGLIGGVLGSTAGFFGGLIFGESYIELTGIKRLPTIQNDVSLTLIIPAFAYFILTLLFTTIGALLVSRRVLKMNAIEVMRPHTLFKSGKRSFIEHIFSKSYSNLSPLLRFSLRSVFQDKRKATFIIFGIVLSTAISFFGTTFGTSFVTGIDKQFNFYQTWDVQVIFTSDQNSSLVSTLIQDLPIEEYEPIILTQIRLKKDQSRIYMVTGLIPNTKMRRFDSGEVPQPYNLVLTKDIVVKSGLSKGENVTLFDVHGVEHNLTIEGILNEMTGASIYTSIETARILAGINDTDVSSGLYIQTASPEIVKSSLRNNSVIKEVVLKSELEKTVTEAVAVGMSFMFVVMSAGIIVGVLISITVVSISISERNHDFTNFRALGVSNREIFLMILFELVLAGLIGISFGFVVGYILSDFIITWSAMFGIVLVLYVTPVTLSGTVGNVLLGMVIAAYLSLRSLFKTTISKETVSRIIG
jgi:putative ABC transport system permease protein